MSCFMLIVQNCHGICNLITHMILMNSPQLQDHETDLKCLITKTSILVVLNCTRVFIIVLCLIYKIK